MKILVDVHAAIEKKTGIGRYCDNLVRALSKNKNIQISLYSNLFQEKLPENYLKYPIYCSPFRNGLFRVLIGLDQASKKLHPDIVHINNFAPLYKTSPIINTVHDVCFKTCPKQSPLKTRFIFKLFFFRSLKLADAIICVSEATKENLLHHYPVEEKKITVIHEACDPTFKYIKNKKRVRREVEKKFGIKKDYFLVVGNIEKRKKPFQTLRVFEELIKNNKNVQLVFAGPNTLKNFPPDESKKLIKNGHLKILSYVSNKDLNLLYNEAKALIYNSHCEGFGLPLLEAMNCHTPIICSDLAVLREVATDAALYVESEKDLLQAIKQLIANEKLRKRLIQRGNKRAKDFSWEKTAKETIKVYKRVFRNNSS